MLNELNGVEFKGRELKVSYGYSKLKRIAPRTYEDIPVATVGPSKVTNQGKSRQFERHFDPDKYSPSEDEYLEPWQRISSGNTSSDDDWD